MFQNLGIGLSEDQLGHRWDSSLSFSTVDSPPSRFIRHELTQAT
jgi:hypothetical protein